MSRDYPEVEEQTNSNAFSLLCVIKCNCFILVIAFEREGINQAFTKSGCHCIMYELVEGRETYAHPEGIRISSSYTRISHAPDSPLSRGALSLNMNFAISHSMQVS